MHRLVAPLVLALGLVAFAPGRATACSMAFVDFFTRFDDAPIVAEIEVTAIDASGAVAMKLNKALKGTATGTLAGHQGGMCPPTYEQGETGVAFFDANGQASWIEPKVATGVLAKWKAAKTAKAKRKLLAKLVKSKNHTIKLHAQEKLNLLGTAAPAWKAPGTEKAANARLVALWPEIRAGAPNNTALAAFDDSFANKTCAPSAGKTTGKTAADQVRDTMGKHDPAVLGSLAALDALGDDTLWLATCSRGFFSVFAYLNAEDGALVMLWMPPEG